MLHLQDRSSVVQSDALLGVVKCKIQEMGNDVKFINKYLRLWFILCIEMSDITSIRVVVYEYSLPIF